MARRADPEWPKGYSCLGAPCSGYKLGNLAGSHQWLLGMGWALVSEW